MSGTRLASGKRQGGRLHAEVGAGRARQHRADEAGPDDGFARPGCRHAMRRAESARTAYYWFGWLLL